MLPAAGLAANGVSREAGSNRFDTSAVISRRHFSPGVNVVYIVNGSTGLTHALAAGPAAAQLGGPILFVRQDSIPGVIETELDRLNPAKIIVVGRRSQVSDSVMTQLGDFTAGSVSREAGADRFSTSAVISRRHFDPGVNAAYIANGSQGIKHSMTAGAAAAELDGPLLFVREDDVPGVIETELERLNPDKVIVVGRRSHVSNSVMTQLGDFTTGSVSREAGSSAFGTSAVVSRRHFSPGVEAVYIVNGSTGLQHAMAAAPSAAALGGPILLVRQDSIPGAVETELERLNPDKIIVVGRRSHVSNSVMIQLEAFIAPPPNQPPVATNDDLGTLVSGCGWQELVLANDSDPDDPDSELEVTAVSDPAHGTATILPTRLGGIIAPRAVRYTSDPGYTGSDSITYTVSDRHGGSDQGTISVNVTASTADEDGDGVRDACDPFAADATNDSGATLPFLLNFAGGDGGLVDSGFVGLLTNSRTASLDLLDSDVALEGGAIVNPSVDGGDAHLARDDQRNALQANLEMPSGSFRVHGVVCNPLPNAEFGSVGIFFGTGDQDNYIKAVVGWNASAGAPQVHDVREVNGQGFGIGRRTVAAIADAECVDLYLNVHPGVGTYSPQFALDGGERMGFGGDRSRRTVPSSWFGASDQLAVGIIATSQGPSPEFEATWNRIEVTDL